MDDPDGITNEFNLNNKFQGTRSIVWKQSPNTVSEVSTTTINFNPEVDQLCLNFLLLKNIVIFQPKKTCLTKCKINIYQFR